MMHAATFNPELTAGSPRRRPSVAILGIRGIPAGHGGFETFAARLAPQLVAGGWDVLVYCQEEAGPGVPPGRDRWADHLGRGDARTSWPARTPPSTA